MRQVRTVQASLFDGYAGHEIGRELKAMSEWLDRHRELLDVVTGDLCRHQVNQTGRQGLPAESVLRCALLKQHRSAELRGTGVPSGGFGVVSGLCPPPHGLDTEEVRAAKDHRSDPGGELAHLIHDGRDLRLASVA